MKNMKATRPLDPLSDYYIRYLFGSESNKDLLMDFINAVFSEKGFPLVVDLEIRNPFNFKSSLVDKETVVDILAKDSTGRQINVEIQNDVKDGFEQRSLYYWANIYRSQLDSGERYYNLKPTVCINLLNSSIFPDLLDFHSCFRITEKDHSDCILTEDLQIHFIELPKLIVNKGEDLDDRLKIWCYYLEKEGYLEEEDMPVLIGKDPIIRKARKEYSRFTADDEKMALAEAREKYLKDYNSDMYISHKRGMEEAHLQDAQKMIAEGLESPLISKITGLSVDEVNELRKK